MADEPLPLGTLPPETQQRAAEAEEIRAIEERADAAAAALAGLPRSDHPTGVLVDLCEPAHADRARLLVLLREALGREATARADLREAREEAGRLRPIVEGVADLDLVDDEWPHPCKSCGGSFLAAGTKHAPTCLGERARTALRPAGTPARCGACTRSYEAGHLRWICCQCERKNPERRDACVGCGHVHRRPAGTLASLDDACDGSDR